MPYERAQAITNTFATIFLNSVVRGAPPIRLDEVDGQEELIYQVTSSGEHLSRALHAGGDATKAVGKACV